MTKPPMMAAVVTEPYQTLSVFLPSAVTGLGQPMRDHWPLQPVAVRANNARPKTRVRVRRRTGTT